MRVATLHKAPHFNHTVAIDTFYVEWDKEKKAVFTILDEFSRYEVDCEIKDETAEMELALFDSTWAKSFGYPKIIRMDASGPHQGELFAEWASNHGIKVNLIPRGAHHRLGILEREPCREKKDAGNFQGRSSNLQLRTSAAGDGTSEEQTEFSQGLNASHFGIWLCSL